LSRAGAGVALALCAAALTACGSGDDGPKRFSARGYGITFTYPGSFERAKSVSVGTRAGERSAGSEAVALDQDNGIFISRYRLRVSVNRSNIDDIKPEADRVIGRIVGRQVSGRARRFAGLPAFDYGLLPVTKPKNGRSRVVLVFSGRTEYEISCQSAPDKLAEVQAACRQVLRTLRTTSG
jgi:hypothetical protein